MRVGIDPCLALGGRVTFKIVRTANSSQVFSQNPAIERMEHHGHSSTGHLNSPLKCFDWRNIAITQVIPSRIQHSSMSIAVLAVAVVAYWLLNATCERAKQRCWAVEPISRIVPTTITRMTASIDGVLCDVLASIVRTRAWKGGGTSGTSH